MRFIKIFLMLLVWTVAFLVRTVDPIWEESKAGRPFDVCARDSIRHGILLRLTLKGDRYRQESADTIGVQLNT